MIKRLLVYHLLFCLSSTVLAQDLMHIRIDSVNSSFDEFNPVVSPDGNTLYVTKRGHAQNIAGVIDQGDIWYANKTASGWTKLMHAGKVINHQGLNGVVGFSADGQRMYLLNYFDPDGNGGGNLRNGISMSTLVDGKWSKPERLRIKYFQNNSSHLSATISRDEKVLIMSMESFTTEGNEDLYVSFKQDDGEWTQPQGLGTKINTYGQEWTPYLAPDNITLYFSSNAFEGEGSRDIYLTVRQEGSWTNWSEPMNLGPAINTEGVEYGFYIPDSSTEAYFSSTQNSEGRGDIFNFPLKDNVIVEDTNIVTEETVVEDDPEEVVEEAVAVQEDTKELEVVVPVVVDTTKLQPTKPVVKEPMPTMVVMTFQVLDAETEEPIDAKVTITNKKEEVVFQTVDLEGDKKFIKVFEEGTNVQVEIQAAGYLDYKEEFNAKATPRNMDEEFSSSVEAFYLNRKKVGTSIRIDNVLFKRGSASLSNPAIAHNEIDKLVSMMNENADIHIRLEGHTDGRGDASLLKSLSEERVKTVKRYLVNQGIAAERIQVVGYGGSRPIASNETTSGREMNRRVEFVIIR